MSVLSTVVLLGALALPCAQPHDAARQDVTALANEGRIGDAWRLAEGLDSELDRARARAQVAHVAGDLAMALRNTEEALTYAPEDIDLLWRSSSIALTLALDERATAYVSRFADALEKAPLSDDARASWQRELDVFRENAEALEGLARQRKEAVSRARTFSLVALLAAVAVLLAIGRSTAA